MSQIIFDPAHKISLSDGIDLLIDRVERNGRGELIASVRCWNGKPIYSDRVRLSIGKKRREFAKAVADRHPAPQSDIEQKLMECELVLAKRLDETRPIQADDDDDVKTEGRRSQATQILEIVEKSNIELFFAPDEDQAYATLISDDHAETYRVRSMAFRSWLARAYFALERKAAASQALQDAIGGIEGAARYEGEKRRVFSRLASHEGRIYWDLVNERWQQVEISAEGWRIIEAADSPVRFRRSRGMQSLPLPEPGGHLSSLRRFINLPDEDSFVLFAAWLIGALRADGRAFPILCLAGEQGSAKSSAARFARQLIDPNDAPLRGRLRDERDLMISTRASWVISLDNVSKLNQDGSDALSRLATGAGLSTRTLYSDEDETIFQAARPIVITGIPEVAESADLVDRSILIELPPIPEEERCDEEEIWRTFQDSRPGLTGALCDAVSAALRDLKQVRIDRLPRMADFAKWATAAEPAYTAPGAFIDAYRRNRMKANELAMRASEIAGYVDRWFVTDEIKITLVDLLAQLTETYRTEKAAGGDPRKVKLPESWPKSEKALSNELRRCAPVLRRFGIDVRDAGLEPGTKRASRKFSRVETIENNPPNLPTSPKSAKSASGMGGSGAWEGADATVLNDESFENDDLGPESEPSANWEGE